MTTPVKKWPHHAEWARIDSISKAIEGRRALGTILEQTHDIRTVRALARAMECFREIEALLASVGSKVDAEEQS